MGDQLKNSKRIASQDASRLPLHRGNRQEPTGIPRSVKAINYDHPRDSVKRYFMVFHFLISSIRESPETACTATGCATGQIGARQPLGRCGIPA